MQCVWMRDTDELDLEAEEIMLRENPEVVKVVFLHVVSEFPYPEISPPKLINGRAAVFYKY